MKSLIVAGLLTMAAGQYGANVVFAPEFSAGEPMNAGPRVAETRLELTGAEHRSAAANLAIGQDIERASTHFEDAFGKAPQVATAMAYSVQAHGPIKAILYDDPSVKSATTGFAESLGRGLRALADAVARDMAEGTKQLHPQPVQG